MAGSASAGTAAGFGAGPTARRFDSDLLDTGSRQTSGTGSNDETPLSSAGLTPDSDEDDEDDEDDGDLAVDGAELGLGGARQSIALRDMRGRAQARGRGRGLYGDGYEGEDKDDLDDDEDSGSETDSGSVVRGSSSLRPRPATAAALPKRVRYTPDEERAVVRKLDRRLVAFVALLYMLSFLDRSNIGNARVAGMDADLRGPRDGDDEDGWYEWALTAFYTSYIAFEWMSLLWRLVPAHAYVAALVLSWGVTASLQAVAPSYPFLIALRALLGIGEAGFAGIPFYLSFFFRRDELAFRTAVFISAAPLATSFASSLAWVIIKLGESGPIAPWRLLFLIEGFPSVLVAVVAWSAIPDSPQTAPFLTAREKKVARLRLEDEKLAVLSPAAAGSSSRRRHGDEEKGGPRGKGGGNEEEPLRARDVLAVLRDPVAWTTAAMFFLTNMAYSSLPVFLPTILTAMGHDALSAQALAAPPYLLAFVIVLATARASDALRARAPLVAAHALASAAGYGVLALGGALGLAPGSTLRYLAVYPAAVGFFNVVVLLIAWSINNQRGTSRQGGAFALFQVVGQCGPLVGVRLYPDADAPLYERGMRAMACAMLAVAALALLLRWYLARLNRRLDDAEGLVGGGVEEEEMLVGRGDGRRGAKARDGFRYML